MTLQKFLVKGATLEIDRPLVEALELLAYGKHPYRILVTNGEGKVVGIITGRRALEVLMGVRGTGMVEKKGLRGTLEENVGIFMDECHEIFLEDIGVEALLKFMVENTIGYAVIVDHSRRLKGVFHEVAVIERLRGKRFGADVGGFMSKSVVSARAGTSIGEAAQTMIKERVRRLPVVGSDGRLSGIVTIGDILRHILSGVEAQEGLERDLTEISRAPVERASPTKTVFARPEEDLGITAERMLDNEVSGMPVIDSDGRVLGVVSRIDVLKAVAAVIGIESLKAEING
ncbi:MAG: CBS domain-containing protein [Candidatus Methanosuratincola sp.]|jgi:CBS domain-containing protein|nr:CBS domain-containing protein [Candidatus Methanosuratincola sp.]